MAFLALQLEIQPRQAYMAIFSGGRMQEPDSHHCLPPNLRARPRRQTGVPPLHPLVRQSHCVAPATRQVTHARVSVPGEGR